MLLSDSLLTVLVSVVIALTLIFITYFKWVHLYWKRRNLPYLEPSIPFGNVLNPLRDIETLGITVGRLYDEMKSRGWSHGGIYMMGVPAYLPVDIDYIRNILTRDFSHFEHHGVYYDEKTDPISAHLFALGGTKWRNLRTKLTPTFSPGKIKMMFNTLLECEISMLDKVEDHHQRKVPIDIKELFGCFTTDTIGSCAFGLDLNTFKDEDSPFRTYGKKVFKPGTLGRVLVAFYLNFPKMCKLLGIRQIRKFVSDFFMKVVVDTVDYREKNNVTRKDFMQLLIELKNNNEDHQYDGKSLTIEEIAAQCFIFFVAGFETSSTLMTWTLYELAKNQDIQQKVRDEIETVLAKHGGRVTYDSIQDLKYMNQVLNESSRKYPPVPFITRECVKDYRVPNTDVIIEEGTRVVIPIFGIHRDEDYYPDPERFDPERFSDENSSSSQQYIHMPFGEGPRICIGLRFGLAQAKVGLTTLLKRYNFTLNKKTKEPIKFAVSSFVLEADGQIWLDAEKL